MEELVTIANVNYKKNGHQILDNLNLSLNSGKIIALLGENGEGKTTIMRLLAGLALNWRGNATIAGQPLGVQTKKIVAFLGDREDFHPNWRLKEMIEFYHDFFTDFDKVRAYQLLAFMELNDCDKLGQLSKGMIEKFLLSITLARRAKLYLLDEPLSGVDVLAREKIIQSMLQWYRQDSTMLISTHLLTEIEPLLDEVIFLRDKKVFLHESLERLKESKGKNLEGLYRDIYQL